jgi:allophanate hydrolase
MSAPAISIAVVGAHLAGQPLNHQIVDRSGAFVRSCRTASEYRLFALAGTTPAKPALVREPGYAGPGIEIEIWSMAPAAFGDFVASIPPPMTIGTIQLDDGGACKGFLCEPCALEGAREITEFLGWRAYLNR